jgi:hypothetical protein
MEKVLEEAYEDSDIQPLSKTLCCILIVILVTELNNGKLKKDRKNKIKNFCSVGVIFHSFKSDSFVK